MILLISNWVLISIELFHKHGRYQQKGFRQLTCTHYGIFIVPCVTW